MNKKAEKLLSMVQKPGRYTGGELNSVIKNPEDVDIRFAFCFPDTYEIGMSHLGMKILYSLLNKREDTWCERVFAPWVDMEELMRKNDVSLFALESSDEIKDLLDEFFGVYIFSFLSQSFAEKLEQEKGTETMSATMSEIKEQIIDDIKTGKNGRSVDSVDWSSEEGRNFIKTEFNRILYILAGNED